MKYIEKFFVEYSCGCKHEIGLPEAKILGSGFWQPTGIVMECNGHTNPLTSAN